MPLIGYTELLSSVGERSQLNLEAIDYCHRR